MSCGKTGITIHPSAVEALKLKKGDELVISCDSKKSFFFSIVTNHDRIRGYKLSNSKHKDKRMLTIVSSYFNKAGLNPGLYEIKGFPIFDEKTKLEWFELLSISKK